MISWELALALRDAGLRWSPVPGDRFRLLATGGDGDVFTVSDMTIEPHEFDTGVVLGFNGTTEWALDSVAIEDTLWHPLEAQLRGLLGSTFRALERTDDGYVVRTEVLDAPAEFAAKDASDAYARALLALVAASAEDPP
ncbi:pilus assembly protein CpaE [Cellulosimicrobium protaetiae]|uniref:Pilus assembly protein CpaE n=1 Tax=Cellulosimicrobium protaetiae TaxID=2587808 RepID=A0A6M5UH10_9MICO|nr:pilus assembly protein CpaE [Cellulosimicrobium protaetiae]QJW37866.1 pilus assembly protein CpaE [Cellulosimicrobium protaetiae]